MEHKIKRFLIVPTPAEIEELEESTKVIKVKELSKVKTENDNQIVFDEFTRK